MNIQWNAQGYTQNFSFVHEYGRGLIDLLEGGGLSVLDLGCGNGALTQRLAQAGFRAEGLDASPELLEVARQSYPGLAFHQGDAVDFQTAEPFDAVFSNAVLHWIAGNVGGQFLTRCCRPACQRAKALSGCAAKVKGSFLTWGFTPYPILD